MLVGFSHSPGADVRINLRSRQALVSKKFLDSSQIRSAIKQVSGKAMPKGVR